MVRTVEGTGVIERSYRQRNEYETERFFRAFKSLTSHEEPIRQLITIVITDFYAKLDEDGKKRSMTSCTIQMRSWAVGLAHNFC